MFPIHDIDYDASVARLLRDAALPTTDLPHSRVRFLGAVDGSRLLGCVALEDCGDDALLRSLAVAPSARGAGLGAALLAAAEDFASAQGRADLYLLTTDAAAFFTARGYASAVRAEAPPGIAATAQFSGLCPASSHFMRKRLPAGDASPGR
ncbi:arsenic resistance N-acetyltransferase ArsN2 [Luteimonas viscosa]|uniref:arsenic resistance N-acetyltransferase ArsN2 n=1 Tax=Luteimonas viscosa TaxID=1132694 RepID=UPI001CA452E7|nr:arsenic resistance N-acetyltransferase ArsN2 [Luteimonas viscosa]